MKNICGTMKRRKVKNELVYSEWPELCDIDSNDVSLSGRERRISIQDGGGILIFPLLATILSLAVVCVRDTWQQQQRSRTGWRKRWKRVPPLRSI